MTVVSVCGIAILTCALCMVLRQMTPQWAKIVAIVAGIALLGGAIAKMREQWQVMSAFLNISGYGQLFFVLIKAMGIALLVETVADICRDTGEETLAARLLFFGKVEILMLALPLMRDLLALMQEVLS